MKIVLDGVFIEVLNGDLSEQEIREYLFYLRNRYKHHVLDSLKIKLDGDFVELCYKWKPEKFERIRRITGYLVGATDKWNDAKQAEEKDRVKHI